MKEQKALKPFAFWALVWGLGLAGQLCWNMENQWFNTFVYAKIAKDSGIVTAMVIASALVTTLSTFFFGTISDRRGARRHYVSIGYIAWGICTIGFGMTEFIVSGAVGGAQAVAAAGVLVVLADCVMSFFGSMGNDAGYNVWTNDMTTNQNRGQMGAVLATQPVIGTIAGTLLGGMLIGAEDNYQRLFWVMGGFVICVGIFSLIFLKDSPTLQAHCEGSFVRQMFAVFDIKTVLHHKELLLSSITAMLFFIPFNIYFVHMGNWMIYYLGFTADTMGLVQGIGLILAMLFSIPAIFAINKNKTPLLVTVAVLVNIAGLLLIYLRALPSMVNPALLFSAQNLPLFIGVFLSGAGYVLFTQALTMWTKQLYPETNRGQFEGVRIVFFTLLPMIIGTLIGNIIIKNGAGTVVNSFGITENIPTESIFIWAAMLLALTFIPLYFAAKSYHARVRAHQPKAETV